MRFGRTTGAAAFAIVLAFAAARAADAPAPGAELAIEIAGVGDRAIVRLPDNYDPAREWPAIFFYHGMGGHPTVQPLSALTKGRDFVLVGMPYVDPEPRSRTPAAHEAYLKQEIDALRRAREEVAKRARVRSDRVFLGGTSMGGWTTTQLGEREMPRLAGLIVLLAGRMRTMPFPVVPFQGKPVYIGTGETDANLPAARRAAALYRSLGARVTFEEYAGLGHAAPRENPGLEAWLDAQGRLADAGTNAAEELRGWLDGRIAAVAAEAEPVKRYLAWRVAWDDPRLPLFGAAGEARLREMIPQFASDPAVRAERAAEDELDRLMVADLKVRRLDELRAVRDGLARLVAQHPDTRAGRTAVREVEWVAAALEKSAAASGRATVPTNAAPAPRPIHAPRFDTGRGRISF
jgi:dienelactone hydrolase